MPTEIELSYNNVADDAETKRMKKRGCMKITGEFWCKAARDDWRYCPCRFEKMDGTL